MAKRGYWIGLIRIKDQQAYDEYARRAAPVVSNFGGKFLAKGGRYDTVEGADYPWNVIVEFESFDRAVACYQSSDYTTAFAFQREAADRHLLVVEGV